MVTAANQLMLNDATPTEKEFRDAGFTPSAIGFPMSDRAFAALCAFNGVAPDCAPRVWRYAPNAAVHAYWERQ